MTPHRQEPSRVDQQGLDGLVSPESDPRLAQARERALLRLLELTAHEQRLQTELNECRRRAFLRASVLGIVSLGAWGSVLRRVADSDSWESKSAQLEGQGGTAAATAASQGLAFAWDNLLFQLGSHAFARLAWEHDLLIGNASIRSGVGHDRESLRRILELCEKDPWLLAKAYRVGGWSAPISEELLYRVIPSLLIPGSEAAWSVGIPTSLAYAGSHNLVIGRSQTKRAISLGSTAKLSLDYVPLTQFFLGAFCWYTARRYGELAPVVAHVFNNQAGAISLVLGGRTRQQRYEEFLREELSRPESS